MVAEATEESDIFLVRIDAFEDQQPNHGGFTPDGNHQLVIRRWKETGLACHEPNSLWKAGLDGRQQARQRHGYALILGIPKGAPKSEVRDHAQTLALINQRKSPYEIMRSVSLPPELRVGQGYGKIEWAAHTIFESYTGWFQRRSTADLYTADPRRRSAGDRW